MFDYCVIMAGGSGTRLWPASSSRLAKQFLPAGKGKKRGDAAAQKESFCLRDAETSIKKRGDAAAQERSFCLRDAETSIKKRGDAAAQERSFFSMALERALAVTGSGGTVLVIAGKTHIPHVIRDAASLSAREKKRLVIIGEPAAKNTAPAVACAVAYALLEGRERKNVLVITSDHIIKPLKAFKADAALAAASAARGKLAVFGIAPNRPETGYGYIEIGKKPLSGVCAVAAFHEKPDLQTARKYASGSRFFWNSGMFAFSGEAMAETFRRLAPDVFLPFEKLKAPKPSSYTVSKGLRILSAWQGLENAYRKTKSISFDYAIAEKHPQTVMIQARFDWIDIGNWEEYAKLRPGNGNGNGSQVYRVSGENCYVDSDIPVALAGVEDLIVVIRSGKNGEPAAALITRKGQTQKVREVVEAIKKAGRTELL